MQYIFRIRQPHFMKKMLIFNGYFENEGFCRKKKKLRNVFRSAV